MKFLPFDETFNRRTFHHFLKFLCEDGITTNEDEQLKKITQLFSSIFMDQNAENFIDFSPCKMKEPFTLEEVTKAVTTMKNNKTPGIDQLGTKYGPQIIMSIIAVNKSAETGEKPN